MNSLTQKELSTLIEIMKRLEMGEGNTIIKRDGHRNCRICQLISGRKYDNATRGRHRAPLPGGAQRGNVKERFGERIRRLRTEQKLGLREFATKVGISPTYLSRIETSEEKAPAEDVIRKMAIQLSDSFDELMTLAGRVSEESLNVIKADPGMPEFLRTVGERKLSAEDLMKLLPNEPKKGER